MIEIGAFEAKNTLSSLLDRVEQGEDIMITRRGRPVARLVSVGNTAARQALATRAASELREMRKGVTLGGVSLRDLIEEGRR